MKIKVTTKRYIQHFKGVTSFTVEDEGFFKGIHLEIVFGEGAATHYTDKKHDMGWEIDHKTTPGMGIGSCRKIEISEDRI